MTTKCPACGSEDIGEEKVSESLPVPYGPTASFVTTQHTCNACDESGDFSGANTAIINDALRKSNSESATTMLEHLAGEGISSAFFERALRLPARTTSRWKSGELSSAALALLRSIRTYPWLLEVADANFDSGVAKGALFGAVAGVLKSEVEKNVVSCKIDVSVFTDQVSVNADFRLVGSWGSEVSTGTSEQPANSASVVLLGDGGTL